MTSFKLYENYMKIIGPIGNLMFFFQAYEVFSTKIAKSISIVGFTLSLITLISWLIYGVILKNYPLIIANIVGVAGAILVLIGAFIYT